MHRNQLVITGRTKYALSLLAKRFGSERRALDMAVALLFQQAMGIPAPTDSESGAVEIMLTKGHKAIVDVVDYDRLIRMGTWRAIPSGNTTYAATMDAELGKQLLMHRAILECPDGMVIDHINGNGLDNRRVNLRICSHAENLHNSRPMRGCRYKGVWRRKGYDLWYAVVNRKRVGSFRSEREAALAYNRAAKQEYGEFAYLNEVEES